ncbi:integrase, catalytic region, zinc finger, CCHC-type containing protein, partial [Tanacetum coccineum]
MSTSTTHQQSLADAGSETRPHMLERVDAEIEAMNLILISIPNEIYNSVDACSLAYAMWKRVERLMRGTVQDKVDRETRFTNEFDQFVAAPGEELVSQFKKLVNALRAKKLEKSHDPLALVAHTGSSSRNTSSYYVTHPPSVVDYDDEYQKDVGPINSEDPLTSAINQASIQGDRVNIQSRNSGNTGRNTRRDYVQEEVVEGSNAQTETGNVQRNLRTSSLGNTTNVQCYNCGDKGHYARNYPKLRVRDSKYFIEQMLLAKQDEAGIILTDEQNDFLFADASRMEEIEDLSANICLMARIQPANTTFDDGPSYDSAFVSKVQSSSINHNQEQVYPTHTKIINNTIGDDQINSNIIFDEPNGNVNSGSVEEDTHVPNLYELEKLARNAYQKAEKKQLFAQKVQQQNMTLTSQLEVYKKRVRVLENKTENKNYFNEYIEADRKAKRFDQQAQSQFVRDRDIIRDLEKQRDKLDLAVIEYKRKNEELQKTHSKLKRQMSENEDNYHDTVLDLEGKLKKNVDLMMKLGNSLQGMFMLGPKSLSVYDPRLKHGLGYPNPYTLKQAISQCPKFHRASSLGNPEVPLDVRDTEDILDDASKSQTKMKEKMNDPIAVEKKQNCWSINYKQINALYDDFVPQKELSAEQKYFPSSFISPNKTSNATTSIPVTMPNDSYLIRYLERMKKYFETLFEVLQKNCKRESIFFTSPAEIKLNEFCQEQIRLALKELHVFYEAFRNKFQGDIKEMKDVFESTESDLCETKKQNEFLKDQLLEEIIKHEVQINVLKGHECVDNSSHAKIEQIRRNSIEIQEGMQARIKVLEKDVQRCQKQSVDFELKLQHEKEKRKWESSLKNNNANSLGRQGLDYSWISKMEKLENENVSLDFTLKARLKNIEKGLTAESSVRRPMHRDSNIKKCVLVNSKISAKKVEVYVKKNKQTDTTSANVISNKENVIDVDVANASKAKVVLYISCLNNVIQIILWIVDSGCSKHMTGDRSLLRNFIEKFMGTVRFRNENFAAITGYGDYIQGNITICHVYYVEGLGHNLFSVGQFCDGDLEVAFRSKTCYMRNLEGDDLLTGDRESNLYTTISISDMAASSPVCLMSKATSTKSWLWHRRLSHLNFGTINDLTRLDLVDGLPKFKYGKDHLCSACERGKSKKASHPPKLVSSNHSKLEMLHMDLCGPMRVASINGKKYILVIVDDYSRYTWVYFLHSKDETPEIIKKFITQAQLNYKAKVCKIRTDNGTEFKNATLKAHYEKLGIMQQFSTDFHVFGSLCYPTNDRDDLGKMKPKADIGV